MYKTVVTPCVMDEIPFYGISPVPFNRILDSTIEWDHLIDIIGLITGVGQIKEYERGGKASKMIVVELTSDNLKLECALFGEYVDQLQTLISNCGISLPVLVIQYTKVKSFRGNVGIQNVLFASRLLCNPDSDDVNSFRDSISTVGNESFRPMTLLADSSYPSEEEDFMKLTPRANIERLTANEEDGCFIICGIVNAIVEDGQWWYGACKCGRVVDCSSGIFICDFCDTYSFSVTPRYKVKLEVRDDTGTAIFVLFERDCTTLFKKSCVDFFLANIKSTEAVRNAEYPSLMFELVGKKLLFKIETKSIGASKYYGTFRVKRVCDDPHIIEMFNLDPTEITPIKDTFMTSLSDAVDLSIDVGDAGVNTHAYKNAPKQFKRGHTSSDCEIVGTFDGISYTPSKRNLEDEFDEEADDCAELKMKSVKVDDI